MTVPFKHYFYTEYWTKNLIFESDVGHLNFLLYFIILCFNLKQRNSINLFTNFLTLLGESILLKMAWKLNSCLGCSHLFQYGFLVGHLVFNWVILKAHRWNLSAKVWVSVMCFDRWFVQIGLWSFLEFQHRSSRSLLSFDVLSWGPCLVGGTFAS